VEVFELVVRGRVDVKAENASCKCSEQSHIAFVQDCAVL
jgi:hypothetical protein